MRFVLFCALMLAACTPAGNNYRTIGPETGACDGPFALGAGNSETGPAAACFVQRHEVPAPAAQSWQDIAAQQNVSLQNGDDYTIAFVEMSEASQTYSDPAQMQAALAALDGPGQTYLVTYIHGWRHDAAIGNTDVAKFRVLMGYARAALNTRCVSEASYCDARLVGVYLSWRGRSFREPTRAPRAGLNPSIVGALPTYAARKAAGERHVDLIGDTLRAFEDRLSLDPGNNRADKMLVFGHSMGANMLLTLADDMAVARLGTHRPGSTMAPLFGDLVVLINAASEASKWVDIQTAERRRAGLMAQDRILSQRGNQSAVAAHEALYPASQRPVLVSLTSTNDWAALSAIDSRRALRFDWATGVVFPIGQTVLAGKTDPLDRTAVGHLKPDYVDVPDDRRRAIRAEQKRRNDARADGDPLILLPKPWLTETETEPKGASHEYALTRGGGTATTYAASAVPGASWCDPAHGWLLQARATGGSPRGVYFDWGLEKREVDGELKTAAIGNVGAGRDGASGQWRNRMYMAGHRGARSVAAARSPFWNTRVLDNAIREHDGFQNYVLWCNINQLVLDDVTRPRVAPAVLAAEEAVSTAEAEAADVIEGESADRLEQSLQDD